MKKPFTAKSDMAADRKAGIKEGSKRDVALDKKRGVLDTPAMKREHAKGRK